MGWTWSEEYVELGRDEAGEPDRDHARTFSFGNMVSRGLSGRGGGSGTANVGGGFWIGSDDRLSSLSFKSVERL